MIELSYGRGSVGIELPRGRFRLVRAEAGADARPALPALRSAVAHPCGSPPLEDMVRRKEVALLVEDATRSAPHAAFVTALMERFSSARSVTAIVATGSHERLSEGNRRIVAHIQQAARREGVRCSTIIHDCRDASSLQSVGRTKRGTPVEANRRALACEVFVVTSDMKNHYFAGYSCAVKCLLPGICSYDCIEANHALALEARSTFGVHPFHPDPNRRDNPLARDICEGAELILEDRPAFVLAAVTAAGQVLWSGAGRMKSVVPRGIQKVDELTGRCVSPASRVVISPGGHPADETLYNSQRGVELARNVIAERGELLLLARCPRGVAPTEEARRNFYDRLTAPLEEVLRALEERYLLYSHKAYKFATMLRSLRRLRMYTELDRRTVHRAHMEKADSPQAVVERWLEESDEPILIVDDANRLALYPPSA